MSDEWFTNCVFCDDVRFEVGNKMSLMGIYQGDIILNTSKPSLLPRFAVALWVISPIDDPVKELTVRILLPPDRKELVKANFTPSGEVNYSEGATKRVFFIAIPMSPFPLEDDGFIEVYADTEKGSARAGRLMVRFAPAPKVATDPSS